MFYQTLITLILLSPWQDVSPQGINQSTWGLVLLLGVVLTVLPHDLFTTDLRFLSAKTVGLESCLQPFYGAVLALLILDEQLTTRIIIGGTLIVATALF